MPSFILSKSIWIVIGTAILAFVLGIFADRIFFPARGLINQPVVQKSNLYYQQTAQIRGRITAIKGNKISVTNNQNTQGEVVLSGSFDIIKYGPGRKITQSTNTADLELNKDTTIDLKFNSGLNTYEAISITYIPPLPINNKP